jgi:hypothetical protein
MRDGLFDYFGGMREFEISIIRSKMCVTLYFIISFIWESKIEQIHVIKRLDYYAKWE